MRLIFDNILVIDDDEIGTHLNCSIIKKLGIARHVINKKNGQEAIDYIKMQYYTFKSLPSLILLDLNMPVMDGFEFIKEMKKSDFKFANKIPITILTSSTSPKDFKRIIDLGDLFYVTKPLTQNKLLEILTELLPSDIIEDIYKNAGTPCTWDMTGSELLKNN
jgi:CheY-like chemotaxis protein